MVNASSLTSNQNVATKRQDRRPVALVPLWDKSDLILREEALLIDFHVNKSVKGNLAAIRAQSTTSSPAWMPDVSQLLTVNQDQDVPAAQAATVEVAEAAEDTKDRDALTVQTAAEAVVDAAATVVSQAKLAGATSVDTVAQMAGAVSVQQEAPAASKVDVEATSHLKEEPLRGSGSRPLVDLTVVEAAEEAPAPALVGEVAPALEATEDRQAPALVATAEEAAGGTDATN